MTLRKVFAVVAVFAVACAALKFPGLWAPILFGVAFLLVAGMMIVAFVDRGSRQAFAIGFALAALSYAATFVITHTAFGGGELDPYSCRLPTTKILAPAYTLLVERSWTDLAGKELPNYVPPRPSSGGGFGTTMVLMKEVPDRVPFTAAGHILWTLLFGYVGGHFGRLIYARRDKR